MVGRKPKSKKLGLRQVLKLPVYQITAQPEFVRGAKREIRDNDGKLLFHARRISVTVGFVFEKYLELVLTNLKNAGHKNLKSKQMVTDVPAICPSCNHEGNAVWNYQERGYSTELNPPIRIWYNHTKTKPKRCYFGSWDYKIANIKLKKGIDPRKMFASYYLKEGEVKEFPLN